MKKQHFYITGLIVVSALLLVACTKPTTAQKEEVHMKQKQEEELKKAQDSIALYLVNHYEDVQKIEFVTFYKGGFGQSDSISVLVNDESYISPIDIEVSDNNYVIGYNPEKFKLVRKKVPSNLSKLDLEHIDIVYYSGEEND